MFGDAEQQQVNDEIMMENLVEERKFKDVAVIQALMSSKGISGFASRVFDR